MVTFIVTRLWRLHPASPPRAELRGHELGGRLPVLLPEPLEAGGGALASAAGVPQPGHWEVSRDDVVISK